MKFIDYSQILTTFAQVTVPGRVPRGTTLGRTVPIPHYPGHHHHPYHHHLAHSSSCPHRLDSTTRVHQAPFRFNTRDTLAVHQVLNAENGNNHSFINTDHGGIDKTIKINRVWEPFLTKLSFL